MPAQPFSSTWTWQETSKVLRSTDGFADLESIVRQHSRFVFKLAYGVLHNAHDAEDVVQEVFLRLHRHGTKGVADMRAWLATLTFRIAIDRTRRAEAVELGDLEPPSVGPDAEAVAIHRQRVAHVQRLIAALPDELRYPLVLSAMDELNSRQIAEVLGISEAAVRGRIFRARQLLKDKVSSLLERSHER
jgi:RNA polymerase sigma-70 factor, ECF subfamily